MSNIKIHYKDPLGYYSLSTFLKEEITTNTIIVCIGTDRCIGDCLGPLVGSMLEEKFFPLPVYGTIQNPIHALNLDDKLTYIKAKHPDSKIIGIDACLGPPGKIGEVQIKVLANHFLL